MRIAHQFHRADVDVFLDEIDHEQFEEWQSFFELEPQGWEGLRRGVTRICYWMSQVQTKKRLRERDYELKMTRQSASPEIEKARWQAAAIRSEIAERYQRPRG